MAVFGGSLSVVAGLGVLIHRSEEVLQYPPGRWPEGIGDWYFRNWPKAFATWKMAEHSLLLGLICCAVAVAGIGGAWASYRHGSDGRVTALQLVGAIGGVLLTVLLAPTVLTGIT